MAVQKPRVRRGVAYTLVAVVAFAAGGLVTSAADPDVSGAAPAATASPGVLDKAAVEGMLAVLDDRWSAYYAPQDYSAFSGALQGRYTGVGLWLRQGIDGEVTVASVQPGSPAADQGVKANDVLLL